MSITLFFHVYCYTPVSIIPAVVDRMVVSPWAKEASIPQNVLAGEVVVMGL